MILYLIDAPIFYGKNRKCFTSIITIFIRFYDMLHFFFKIFYNEMYVRRLTDLILSICFEKHSGLVRKIKIL